MNGIKTYRIYNLKTGQPVALLDADGTLHDGGDPQAQATLRQLLQRELVVRDRHLGFTGETEDERYEPFPDESMCYLGLTTLHPGDPEYFNAFLNCLPAISIYEARACDE